MSMFYVGQRVKVARYPKHTGPRATCPNGGRIGDEGIVAGTESCPNLGFWSEGGWNLSVKLDRLPSPHIAPDYCFEPILPEGLESNEEIDALWEPSPVEELENAALRKESRA